MIFCATLSSLHFFLSTVPLKVLHICNGKKIKLILTCPGLREEREDVELRKEKEESECLKRKQITYH